MNLSQAKSTPKQLNLNKLSNAGGSQIYWQATLAKTDSSIDFGIKRPWARTGLKSTAGFKLRTPSCQIPDSSGCFSISIRIYHHVKKPSLKKELLCL